MTYNNQSNPLFTLRIDQLVGRSSELKKLRKVLNDLKVTSDQTLLFYIAGDGGMGKTRLLEWVQQNYAGTSKTWCTGIIDFYDSMLRADVDLVERIYDSIHEKIEQVRDKQLTAQFENYRELRDQYRRQEMDELGGTVRQGVIEAFVTSWTPLVEAGYRLIVLLDTAELLRFVDDEIREKFNAPPPFASSQRWVMDVADDDAKLPGVLFVVAGRKKESLPLYEEFRQRAGWRVDDPEQRMIELSGLKRSEVDVYFDKLAGILEQKGHPDEAEQIRKEINVDLRTAFHTLTEGSPMALAISLQLLLGGVGNELPKLLNEQLDRPGEKIDHNQEKFRAAIVTELANFEAFGDLGMAVRYMALARKGLTPALLKGLITKIGGNPPELDFEQLFEDLAQHIYIKKLPDGSLVLHDKVAEWASGVFENADAIVIYKALTEIYKTDIEEETVEIDRLIANLDMFVEIDEYEDIVSEAQTRRPPDAAAIKSIKELKSARRTRRDLYIEQMTYALRADPAHGYRIYYELAEEAFNVGRMDYDMQIRTDFMQWWMEESPSNSEQFRYREQAKQYGVTKEIVEADLAVRAVQRTYSTETIEGLVSLSPAERSQATIDLVERILRSANQPADTFILPDFAQTWLQIYVDMARGQLIEKEEDITTVRRAFNDHIKQLKQLQSQYSDSDNTENLQAFLLMSALAFAHYELGYFESNHGNHHEAIENFTASQRPYRKLGFEINQARSLNDKAYSLAIVGDAQRAETAVLDALKLRRRLGFNFPIGLSYNTLGIVHTLAERPSSALQYCGYALSIFRSLRHEFGQMIAYRAISEASRRDGERLSVNRRAQERRLIEAYHTSRAAVFLSNDLLTDKDVLKVDVMVEYGSVLRDLARFYWQNPDLYDPTQKNYAEESQNWLLQGITLAKTIPGSRSQLVDAMVDLAHLHSFKFYSPNADKNKAIEQAERATNEAIQQIPEEYWNLRHPGHNKSLTSRISVYWSYLSKAHGLLVWIKQQSLLLESGTMRVELSSPAKAIELLQEATLTLYFRSFLEANVRNVRRSNQIVYEAFQAYPVETLEWFSDRSVDVAKALNIPVSEQGLMIEYFEENLGV